MDRALQIIGFGAIAVDDLVYVDQLLSSGKGKVTRRITAHGGNVATALVAAAKLGARVGFAGWLNTDTDRDVSVRNLLANGVDISCAPRHPDAHPIQSTIIVGSDGDRFIAYDDDVMMGTTSDLSDGLLQDAQVLLVDGYAIFSLDVLERAARIGLAIVADIEWSAGPRTDRLVALADHLVLPLGYAAKMAKSADPVEILNALWSDARSAVVLTDGDAGVYVRQKGDQSFWHFSAFEVEVVDTTGAGDCFHGAYSCALAEGSSPESSARFAAAAAALSVTGRGGRDGLPSRVDVETLLSSAAPLTKTAIFSFVR